jgi:SAM-dependent methyltransferase
MHPGHGSGMSDRFVEIYRTNEWGSEFKSGPGSAPEKNKAYIQILTDTIAKVGAVSVVDFGCGDWSFSRSADWSGIDYTGVDVVPELVADLNVRYGAENIRFVVGDSPVSHIPDADLLISKDVLQHWSNEAVAAFLPRLGQFKYAILTNDLKIFRKDWRSLWRYRPTSEANADTTMGGYRPLDLRAEPFGLEAEELASYDIEDGPHLFVKEVLLWTNPASS